MNTYKFIETKSLLITLFIRIFSNRIIVVFYDIIMTTLFAIHTSRIDLKSKRWINTLIIYIAIYIFLNVLSIVADKLDKRIIIDKNIFLKHMSYTIQLILKQLIICIELIRKLVKQLERIKLKKKNCDQSLTFKNCHFLFVMNFMLLLTIHVIVKNVKYLFFRDFQITTIKIT